MISDSKPYPAMKDSGVPWLGRVPEHWLVRRIKMLFREKDGRSGDGHGVLLSMTRARGIIPQAQASNRIASSEDLSKYKVCRHGDLVMNRMQAWSGMFAMSLHEGLVSPDYSVFGPIDACNVKYFEHLFKTPVLVDQFAQRSKGIGSGFNRLYTPDFGSVSVVVPPLSEQSAIVLFLDQADRLISHYIRAKQKLIKLLEEQKQVIIHHAVTRGLDPNVRLKPSGVEWLGDVPEHWKIVPLRRVVEVKDGTHDTPSYVEPSDASFPLITSKDFEPSSICFEHAKHISAKDHCEVVRRSNTERGDVLMSMIGGNIGKALIVDSDREFSIKNVALFKTCHSSHLSRFILYYLRSGLLDVQISLVSKGGAQGFLALGQIRNLVFLRIPTNEMEQIVDSLDLKLLDYDALIAAADDSLKMIAEYRTSLISDVVTGKLDVRVARLPIAEKVEIPEEWNGTFDAESDLTEDLELPELIQESGD